MLAGQRRCKLARRSAGAANGNGRNAGNEIKEGSAVRTGGRNPGTKARARRCAADAALVIK